MSNVGRLFCEALYGTSKPQLRKRPTIAELEEILSRDEDVAIEILPNGEVRSLGSVMTPKPLTMRESLGGEYA